MVYFQIVTLAAVTALLIFDFIKNTNVIPLIVIAYLGIMVLPGLIEHL